MLTPSNGACWMPLTDAGAGSPAASRNVGAMSMTWWNWLRTAPASVTVLGQCTIVPLRVPPQCEATCLVHWWGVHIACAQPTGVVVVRRRGAEVVDLAQQEVDALDAGIPLSVVISLNAPFTVPSADAPLSPMM